MSEYEKMIAGKLYHPLDPELVLMKQNARRLLSEINGSAMDIHTNDRRLLLCEQLFGAISDDLWLQPPFYCDYGKNIHLGAHVTFNFDCIILDAAKVTIGAHVFIGPRVQIYTVARPLEVQKRNEGLEYGKPVTIQDNVWIGGSAVICPGVTIGEGSVIAPGAVVTEDVAPRTLVGGNPAKVIKTIDQ